MKNNEKAKRKSVELKKPPVETWENEGGEIPEVSERDKEARSKEARLRKTGAWPAAKGPSPHT